MVLIGHADDLRTVWQVQLDGGWKDLDLDECRLLEEAVARKEETLRMPKYTKHMFVLDVPGSPGQFRMYQRNETSNMVRPIRTMLVLLE
jgi:hypothetical protein